jgi:glycosyltransferase involved in cell wall biosynthesis
MSRPLTESPGDLLRASESRGSGLPRVSFVTDLPTPYMLEVLAAMAEMVELTVLFCAPTGSRALPWSPGERPTFRHRVIGGLAIRSGVPGRPDYFLSPRIPRAVLGSRPDAVVSGGFSIPTAYAALCGLIRGAPLIIYSDGTSHYERTLGRHQRIARSVLLQAASACVANSRPAAERFIELGVTPTRVFLAPHSSTMEPLWRIARERDYERGGKFTILTAGRLVPHKGIDMLLRAVARIGEGSPPIRLIIAGSGPELPRLRRLAGELGLEDVQFRGFVDHADMPQVYAEADIFAFPTFEDPFGIVLLEAAAAGLPLVASLHAGASWDLIANAESGVIVDPADLDGFAACLEALARDPGRRRQLGRTAHRGTLGRSPRDSARGYVSAIESCLAGRGAGRR